MSNKFLVCTEYDLGTKIITSYIPNTITAQIQVIYHKTLIAILKIHI